MNTANVSAFARKELGENNMKLLDWAPPHKARIGIIRRGRTGPWIVRYHEGNLTSEARGADIIETILEALRKADRSGIEWQPETVA